MSVSGALARIFFENLVCRHLNKSGKMALLALPMIRPGESEEHVRPLIFSAVASTRPLESEEWQSDHVITWLRGEQAILISLQTNNTSLLEKYYSSFETPLSISFSA
jgi:hypothetical protein